MAVGHDGPTSPVVEVTNVLRELIVGGAPTVTSASLVEVIPGL